MPLNVTEFINNAVNNNPSANAEVKAGASLASSFFGSLQSGGINASTIVALTDNLPANVQANIKSFTSNITANIKLTSAIGQKNSSTISNKGIEQAKTETFTLGAPRGNLDSPIAPIGVPLPKVKSSVPQLRESDVKALMVQIAHMETADTIDYNEPPRYGRYAVHNKTLINYGYKFSNAAAFTGKDGVTSEIEFLFDTNVQDRIMERYIINQYQACIKSGAIRDNDTKEVVAGILAAAYQLQDANPSVQQGLSSVTGLMSSDTSSLVSAASGLSEQLGGLINSAAAPVQAASSLLESGINSISQNLQSALPKVSVSKSGITIDKSALTNTQNLTSTAEKAASSVAESLNPALTGSAQQLKNAAAKVDVSKLKSAGDEFANSIPAGKVKQWRQEGSMKDSQGRPISLFYNAGRYAVQNLGADIEAP
jgi:hypothetical protein